MKLEEKTSQPSKFIPFILFIYSENNIEKKLGIA